MYLSLQPLLERGLAPARVFVDALDSERALRTLLPDVAPGDPLLQRLQQVRSVGPIFLDLAGADTHLSEEEVGTIVRTVRDHWHSHGFCIARCNELQRWNYAAAHHQQPLLYWTSLSPMTGWHLLGAQLRATELDVFRLLVSHGTVAVEQVARNPTIFSQRPSFNDPRVVMDLVMERKPRGPIESNRSDARQILTRMHQRRLVTSNGTFYAIVRPTRGNGV